MTELEQALKIADMWLDGRMNSLTQLVPGDPDCDACVVARQLNRAVEREAAVRAVARTLLELCQGFVEASPADLPNVQRAKDLFERMSVTLGLTPTAMARQ